jgi:NAD(P)-dependent dehydrogenase (short-subunit alcohol dehydrogenase family)
MSKKLEGKTAVITGGASGIGLATVERFADEGASVVFCDLAPVTQAELESRLGSTKAQLHHTRRPKDGPNDGWAIAERLGNAVTFVPCDVTDVDQLANVIDTAVHQHGGLDVLFNNAGVGGAEGTIVDCPEERFDRIIEVNLKAVWMGIKLAAPHLMSRGGGSIISMSSIAGVRGVAGTASYAAAKAGVIGLTRTAAMELARHSIRVNAICPGVIVTPILFDSPLSAEPIGEEAVRAMATEAHPLPKMGEPGDIANVALWLASDDSALVTAQAIVADGGVTSELDARGRGLT